METAVPFQATLRIFNFPGWRVRVNDEPVPITRSDPEGWITFPVENGRSTIQATFSETPLRLAANGVALLSLLLLGAVFRYSVNGKQYSVSSEHSADHRPPTTDHGLLTTAHWLLIITAILLLTGKLLATRTPLLQDGSLRNVDVPMTVTLGTPDNPVQVRLLGLDEWETAVPADHALVQTLYWQAIQPLSANYKVGLTLLDENGIRWSEIGLRDYRWLRNPPPTTAWPTDQYARTSFFIDLLPGTPPGDYQLQLSFFEEGSLIPLTFYQDNGQPLGPQFNLGMITVEPPDQPWPTSLAMQHRLDAAVGDTTLLGSNVDRGESAPGDPLLMTLFWLSSTEAEATLLLVNEVG